jgi:UDP-galactose transporter B1
VSLSFVSFARLGFCLVNGCHYYWMDVCYPISYLFSSFHSIPFRRYVIFPIQVLAKSCKPVPVMLFGAVMGKKYPFKKYVNVCLIVAGVGLFMGGGGSSSKKSDGDGELSSSNQIIGIVLLFISLCFDGGTGAYEDKLMSVHSVGPFDLMYNIQLGKTIIAGVALLVLNQVHVFMQMCQDMGFVLVALGLTGAMGQVFIFVTISKFGALTCSIIGLARKVTTLVASIYFYGHHLNGVQIAGLVVCVTSMVMNFMGKSGKGGGHGHGAPPAPKKELASIPEMRYRDNDVEGKIGDFELPPLNVVKAITAGGKRS